MVKTTGVPVLFWVLLTLSTTQSIAQIKTDYANYKSIESRGSIPDDFLMSFNPSVKNSAKKKLKRAERLEIEKRLSFFSYELHRFMRSGKVLFGDPVTDYLNEVANSVLDEMSDIKHKVRVYTVKSHEPKLYITPDGILFVNIGLLSKLDNESELVFMMTHEFLRYQNKSVEESIVDPLDYYDTSPYISNIWKMYEVLSIRVEDSLKVIKRDKEALEVLWSAGYDLERVATVYQSLREVDVPGNNVPFKKSFFEYGNYIFPDYYFDMGEDSLQENSLENDSCIEFYPLLEERSKMALETVDKIGRVREDYINDSTEFHKIRLMADFELSEIYLRERMYCQAIYNCHALMQKYPESVYLKSTIARSLLLLSKYKHRGYLDDVLPDYDKLRGEIRGLCYFLAKMSEEEVAILAASQLFQLEKDFSGSNPWYFTDEAVKHLVYDIHLTPRQFSRDSIERLIDKPDVDTVDGGGSKVAGISRKLTKTTTADVKYIYKYRMYAFDDVGIDTSKFHSMMKKHHKVYLENPHSYRTLRRLSLFSNDIFGYRYDKIRYNKSHNSGFGIDSILVLDPAFLYADFKRKKKIKVDIEKSENFKNKYHDLIRNNLAISGIYGELVSSIELNHDETRKFNEISAMRTWLRERIAHQHMGVPVSSRDRAVDATEFLGADHVFFTDMIVHRMKRKGRYAWAFLCALPVVTFPLSVYHLAEKYNHSYRFNYLFNVRNGQAFIYHAKSFHNPPYDDYLNAQIGNDLFNFYHDNDLNMKYPNVIKTSTLNELLGNKN